MWYSHLVAEGTLGAPFIPTLSRALPRFPPSHFALKGARNFCEHITRGNA